MRGRRKAEQAVVTFVIFRSNKASLMLETQPTKLYEWGEKTTRGGGGGPPSAGG